VDTAHFIFEIIRNTNIFIILEFGLVGIHDDYDDINKLMNETTTIKVLYYKYLVCRERDSFIKKYDDK
jgi:hypothetical protein